ncbi:ABC transporter ATP-binding protein [Chelatococcus asaccharovorans]|uniref:ABC transporter ATP-binding protein n=1 Tax=Chelatococcus asaccharovorans TaxID=28210 RepID=UPI00224C75F7|nr:ABC transporter ATP-binding protein [Chelatococcus asaccharovorans]CAH1651168.1 Amino acid/amide ABC transporter ATP-binding protein 2 (HAAT family) [Chelatococcus asaccharovorans]CAH1686659.1 Amino acid/amide ABC transporter ATP-binding protein 2 (HAAT family) [Chelatococcus asaccharovorans]
MSDAKPVLEIRNLRGGYGEVDILNGIDLVLREKEILTVAGTNGAGKSTLAKAIVGLLPRVTGEIRVDGEDILAVPTYRRMAHGIGYVPQVSNVFAALSITENLQVVAGVPDRKQRIEEMFTLFPLLGERRRARAGSLSGGERQQLAFARALMSRPTLMVLDEPTAALAPAKVAEAFALIARLPSLGVSTLIVEQRARQSLAISDWGSILDGGKVALEGAADVLLADPRAAALYLGQAG